MRMLRPTRNLFQPLPLLVLLLIMRCAPGFCGNVTLLLAARGLMSEPAPLEQRLDLLRRAWHFGATVRGALSARQQDVLAATGRLTSEDQPELSVVSLLAHPLREAVPVYPGAELVAAWVETPGSSFALNGVVTCAVEVRCPADIAADLEPAWTAAGWDVHPTTLGFAASGSMRSLVINGGLEYPALSGTLAYGLLPPVFWGYARGGAGRLLFGHESASGTGQYVCVTGPMRLSMRFLPVAAGTTLLFGARSTSEPAKSFPYLIAIDPATSETLEARSLAAGVEQSDGDGWQKSLGAVRMQHDALVSMSLDVGSGASGACLDNIFIVALPRTE